MRNQFAIRNAQFAIKNERERSGWGAKRLPQMGELAEAKPKTEGGLPEGKVFVHKQ